MHSVVNESMSSLCLGLLMFVVWCRRGDYTDRRLPWAKINSCALELSSARNSGSGCKGLGKATFRAVM